MTGRTSIRTEKFFIAGGTLRRDAQCYISRAADTELFDALVRGELCYVLTSRQMGKSSLMVKTAGKLRQNGVDVCILDLTGLGQNLNAYQWYNGLIERVGQQLGLDDELEDFWNSCGNLGPMLMWTDALREVVLPRCQGQLIIFIDEIDAVRSLPFSADEFFAGIRELHNRRTRDPELNRLTFCLLGVASPTDLIRNVRTTPFNVGSRIELTDFTLQEAQPLEQGLAPEIEVANRLLKRVLYWTNGHPYLTQRLCLAVAEQSAKSIATVDRCCDELFLSRRARQQDDNLVFVRERLLRSEVDMPALLSVFSKVRRGKRVEYEETNPLVTVLRLSGIVRVESGLLKVRNRVYERVFDGKWVTENLPGAEIRRQRTAFVRGLKVAAAVALPVLSAVALYGFFGIYRVQTSVPTLNFKPPEPPAFWASFTRPTALMQLGSLSIRAGEPGSMVFINNREYGRTGKDGQLRIGVLPPASYIVRIEKPGFQSLTQDAAIVSNKETQLVFKLQRQLVLGATLAIQQGAPGTKVSVDGVELGSVGPDGMFTSEVSPGRHSVDLARDGYLTKNQSQDFVAGKKVLIDGQLRPDLEVEDWHNVMNTTQSSSLENFLRKYPNGRFSVEARKRAEDLDWKAVQQSNDLVALDGFTKKYPNGQYLQAAKAQIAQLQREASDWSVARNAHDRPALEAYLRNYPNGQYKEQARDELRRLQDASTQRNQHDEDQQLILATLQQFGEAFDKKNIDGLLSVWPSLGKQEVKKIRDSFREAEAIHVQLQPSREVHIDGNRATVTCLRSLRYTFPGGVEKSENANVAVQLQKQAGGWVIQSVK